MDIASSSYVGRNFANSSTVPPDQEEYQNKYKSYDQDRGRDYRSEPNSPRSDEYSDHHSNHSDYSDHNHDKRHDRHDRHNRSSSEDKEKIVVAVEKSEDFMDYRLLWVFGLVLILVSFLYFYWLSIECDIPENDETNLTMQYALDKALNGNTKMEASEEVVEIPII